MPTVVSGILAQPEFCRYPTSTHLSEASTNTESYSMHEWSIPKSENLNPLSFLLWIAVVDCIPVKNPLLTWRGKWNKADILHVYLKTSGVFVHKSWSL